MLLKSLSKSLILKGFFVFIIMKINYRFPSLFDAYFRLFRLNSEGDKPEAFRKKRLK